MCNNIDKADLSVLFVEDEGITTHLFVQTLKKYYKKVYGALNGEEALKLFKEHKPHIVISDILMPKLNGIELIEKIKEIKPETAIIVMSAVSEPAYIEDALALGVKHYLIKPVMSEELFEVLNKVTSELFEIEIDVDL